MSHSAQILPNHFYLNENGICSPILNLNAGCKVISTDWSIDPEKLGIPKQLFLTCYEEYDKSKLFLTRKGLFDEKLKVLFYLSVEVENNHFLLELISTFNLLSSLDVLVCANKRHADILSSYANEHIRFISFKQTDKIELGINLIITYGSVAIHFMKEKFPLIIAGPYGFGGWVMEENLPYLYKDCFRGRPGGTYGEPIPASILADEILAIKECEDINKVVEGNATYINKLCLKSYSEIVVALDSTIPVNEQLQDEMAFEYLCPQLASNVILESYNEHLVIKRKYINDTLCFVDACDELFFRSMDGTRNCLELSSLFKMGKDDAIETFKALFEEKIIVFEHP